MEDELSLTMGEFIYSSHAVSLQIVTLAQSTLSAIAIGDAS